MYDARHIAFKDIVVHDNCGWFVNIGYNAIMKMDLMTGNVEVEAFLAENVWAEHELFSSIAYYKDKLYIAPRCEKRICIYSIKKKTFSFVELDCDKYACDGIYNLFISVNEVNGCIYFFPGRFRAIVKLNPLDNSVEYIDNWYGELEKLWTRDMLSLVIFNRVKMIGNNEFILPCWRSNVCLVIDVITKEYRIEKIIDRGELADADICGEEWIYSVKRSNKICRGSESDLKSISFDDESDLGYSLFQENVNVCVVPIIGTSIEICDKYTFDHKLQIELPKDCISEQKWLKYINSSLCVKRIESGELLLYSNRNNEILLINIDECTFRRVNIDVSDNSVTEINKQIREILIRHPVAEYASSNLVNYLDSI